MTPVEAFAQIRTGDFAGDFCVNDMVTNQYYQGVQILSQTGKSLARLGAIRLPMYEHQYGTNVIQGHECRPTPEGNMLITGYNAHWINSTELGDVAVFVQNVMASQS